MADLAVLLAVAAAMTGGVVWWVRAAVRAFEDAAQHAPRLEPSDVATVDQDPVPARHRRRRGWRRVVVRAAEWLAVALAVGVVVVAALVASGAG